MLRPRRAVDEDVVEEHQDAAAEERLEDEVHKHLERRGSIRQPEGHDQKFEVAMVGAERCLGNIIRVHTNLVISRTQIKLGKELRPMEFIQKFFDNGDGKFILDRGGVEGPIINTKAPRTITFLNQQHWRRKG